MEPIGDFQLSLVHKGCGAERDGVVLVRYS